MICIENSQNHIFTGNVQNIKSNLLKKCELLNMRGCHKNNFNCTRT